MTNIEIVDIVWKRLNESILKNEITGSIYKDEERPVNSVLEDVVINSLPSLNQDMQRCIVNVNIHVHNLELHVSGVGDTTKANRRRLNDLAAMAIEILDDIYISENQAGFDIQQHRLITEEKSSFYNFRLEFYNINISNN